MNADPGPTLFSTATALEIAAKSCSQACMISRSPAHASKFSAVFIYQTSSHRCLKADMMFIGLIGET
jgi:hypothetical protein